MSAEKIRTLLEEMEARSKDIVWQADHAKLIAAMRAAVGALEELIPYAEDHANSSWMAYEYPASRTIEKHLEPVSSARSALARAAEILGGE
jgi:hypothetical protein